jgi:hypothetical protein
MTILDFRYVPTFLPPHITMKCTCISIYLPITFTCMWVCICKGLATKLGNPVFWGGRTGVWTESVILARQVFLTPEAVLQPLFSDQLFWGRVLWTIWLVLALKHILLISASWVPKITTMRHWDWDLFGFCVTKTEQELNNFLLSWCLSSGVHACQAGTVPLEPHWQMELTIYPRWPCISTSLPQPTNTWLQDGHTIPHLTLGFLINKTYSG